MRMSKTLVGVAVFVTLAGAATVLFGSSSAAEVPLAAGANNLEVWHHIKAVWLPTLLGWLLMLQAPLMLSYLAIALWVFFQERKHDQIYDATKTARKKGEDERDAAAEALFRKEHVDRLSPELLEALKKERIAVSNCSFVGSTRLKEVCAIDFFIEEWRNGIMRSLEEQIPLPALNEEVERNRFRYHSYWIDLDEAIVKSVSILFGTLLGAALGYALVFV